MKKKKFVDLLTELKLAGSTTDAGGLKTATWTSLVKSMQQQFKNLNITKSHLQSQLQQVLFYVFILIMLILFKLKNKYKVFKQLKDYIGFGYENGLITAVESVWDDQIGKLRVLSKEAMHKHLVHQLFLCGSH
jgi:hypothetical protein